MDPLERYLDAARGRPFRWGEHDCALFVAGWVARRRGADPAEALRGRYGTALQAARIAREAGGLSGLADRALGPSGPARGASRGDVLLAAFGQRQALGICVGARGAFLGMRGLAFVPLLRCSLAWHI